MKIPTDSELETELQEMYMQATHGLEDIAFLETETLFFRNIIRRYQTSNAVDPRADGFNTKISEQEKRLSALKVKIPVFLTFLEPFIGDTKKEMDLDFLDRYNALQNELSALFNSIRTTKNELFHYTEPIMSPVRSPRA